MKIKRAWWVSDGAQMVLRWPEFAGLRRTGEAPRASALARLGLPAPGCAPCGAGELRRAYRICFFLFVKEKEKHLAKQDPQGSPRGRSDRRPRAASSSDWLRGVPGVRAKDSESRTAALLVHPDKCSHPQAKLAFQRLSEAFDELSRPGALQGALCGAASGGRGRQPRRAGEPHVPPEEGTAEEVDERGQRGGRAWWDVGWSEFERWLRQSEAEAKRREAAREAAVEAAAARGDDMLDAYMSLITEEATQGMYTGFSAGASGCTASASPASAASQPEGARRARPEPQGPRLERAPPPFQSAKRRCGASGPAGASAGPAGAGISMRLATGGVLAVEAVAKPAADAAAASAAAGALDHLDSDESELDG